jgi:hypothetical protein
MSIVASRYAGRMTTFTASGSYFVAVAHTWNGEFSRPVVCFGIVYSAADINPPRFVYN